MKIWEIFHNYFDLIRINEYFLSKLIVNCFLLGYYLTVDTKHKWSDIVLTQVLTQSEVMSVKAYIYKCLIMSTSELSFGQN